MTDKQSTTDNSEQAVKSPLPPVSYHFIFWPIVFVGIAADLWTKFAVFEWLSGLPRNEYGDKVYVVLEGFFRFVMRYNDGAAFSIMSGKRIVLVSISVLAMLVVLGIFLFGKIDKKAIVVILALFLAGIVGNLYDRASGEGLVRDFLDVHYKEVYHWPAFNIADSMLCIAVGLMLIFQIRAAVLERRSHRQKQEHQAH